MGDPTHSIDGLGGACPTRGVGVIRVGVEVEETDGVGAGITGGVVGPGAGAGTDGAGAGVGIETEGVDGGAGAETGVGIGAGVAVAPAGVAPATGGMMSTWPTHIRLGSAILLARWMRGYLWASP